MRLGFINMPKIVYALIGWHRFTVCTSVTLRLAYSRHTPLFRTSFKLPDKIVRYKTLMLIEMHM